MISGGTIMILGATQATFFVLLLASKRRKTTSDYLLIGYLTLLMIHLLYYFSMFFLPEKVPIVIGIAGFSLVILHTPFFFLYVRTLALEQSLKKRIVMFHTLPYIVYNVILLISHYAGAVKFQPANGFLGIVSTEYSLIYQSGQVLAVVTLCYTLWGFYLLRAFKRRLKDIQSSYISYKWLSFLVLSFLIYFALIYAVLTLALDSSLISYKQVFYYVSFIIMAYVFILGFFGIKQNHVFTNYEVSRPWEKTESKYAKSGLSQEDIYEIEQKIIKVMRDDKLYLDPDVSLPALADNLDLKPPYLSQVINQQFQLNFFDFINGYRVEEVKKRIEDPNYQHLSLLGIAMDCGFKSKSSFNKSFKKYAGMTPSDFKRNLEV